MMTIYSYSFAKKFNHVKFCFRLNKCFLLSLLLGACKFRSFYFFFRLSKTQEYVVTCSIEGLSGLVYFMSYKTTYTQRSEQRCSVRAGLRNTACGEPPAPTHSQNNPRLVDEPCWLFGNPSTLRKRKNRPQGIFIFDPYLSFSLVFGHFLLILSIFVV